MIGLHLIMEFPCVTIWTGHLEVDALGMVTPLQNSRLPNLSHLNFYLWSAIKAIVYKMLIDSEMDLATRIFITVATIHKTLGIFENIHQSMQCRC